MTQDKLLIGSEEWFCFPTLGIPAIKARVDSGAKTSSIHAVNIAAFKREGSPWVSFEVHPLQNDRRTVVRCEAPVVDRRSVKSSSGDAEKRYVIRVPIAMGETSWDVEVTLANRDTMGYRMLLGREAMVGRTLVDPGRRFVHGDLSVDVLLEAYGSLTHNPDEGLHIGLLGSDAESYTNRRIIEAGEERGHSVYFLDIKHCYMKLDAEAPEMHYRGGYLLKDLDAVVPRIDPQLTLYGCALTRQCESMGVSCVNNSVAIGQSRDKIFSLQLLLKHGLNIPVTGFADSPIDTSDVIEMVGGAPLVVKLLDGAQGKGVVLAETDKAAESVINALKSVQAHLLVQEYIEEAQGQALRCLVVDGKIAASILSTVMPGKFGTRGTITNVKITTEEKKLAIKAAKVMNLSVASVDIIRSRKGPLLLDVDPAPELDDLETASNRDLAGVMISAVERTLGWKRKLAVKS